MAAKLPYVVVPGVLERLLNKIIVAQTPSRFTQDFLATKLGFKGGNVKAAIPLLKRLGFLDPDGTPKERYNRFRNKSARGAAMAEGIREAYYELYSRNEYTHNLEEAELRGLVVEVTGGEPDSRVVKAIVSTFTTLNSFADFDKEYPVEDTEREPEAEGEELLPDAKTQSDGTGIDVGKGLRLSYTINLNLPETTNVAVFDAIFKSLKANLLK